MKTGTEACEQQQCYLWATQPQVFGRTRCASQRTKATVENGAEMFFDFTSCVLAQTAEDVEFLHHLQDEKPSLSFAARPRSPAEPPF